MNPATAFAGDALFLLILLVCGVIVPLWAVIDAARRPTEAFYAVRSNKAIWIVAIVVTWFFGLGLFSGGFYLLVTRPKVRRQMEGPALNDRP
jgi:hypothetical protein